MKIDELKGICRKYNVKFGGCGVVYFLFPHLQGQKKENYVANIYRRVEMVHQNSAALGTLRKKIEIEFQANTPPVNEHYHKWFNLLDLADGYWYDAQENHQNQSWKSKMLLGILRFVVINSWVFHVQHSYSQWMVYRENVIKSVLGIKEENKE